MKFELNETEIQKYALWNSKHIKTCPIYGMSGAIGGRLSFIFTPTSLGVITSVKCACGKEKTLTDFNEW